MFQTFRDVEALGFPVQNVYKMTYVKRMQPLNL